MLSCTQDSLVRVALVQSLLPGSSAWPHDSVAHMMLWVRFRVPAAGFALALLSGHQSLCRLKMSTVSAWSPSHCVQCQEVMMRRLALLKAGQRRQVASGIMVYSLVAGEVPAFRAVEEWTQAAALGPIDVMPVQVLIPCRSLHARRHCSRLGDNCYGHAIPCTCSSTLDLCR